MPGLIGKLGMKGLGGGCKFLGGLITRSAPHIALVHASMRLIDLEGHRAGGAFGHGERTSTGAGVG